MKKSKSAYFPVMIELNSFSCIVIGGGSVAARKVNNLLEFNIKKIHIISPKLNEELISLVDGKRITWDKKEYCAGDLSGYKLVFCATDDPEVQKAVKAEADSVGALINVVDIPELCNFIMPATIKRGDLTVSVSSQGKSPFYTKEKKQQIEKMLSPMVADVAQLAAEFRVKILKDESYKNPEKRNALFHDFLAIDWEKILYEEGKKGANKRMEELFE